jgi:hypothetical protein
MAIRKLLSFKKFYFKFQSPDGYDIFGSEFGVITGIQVGPDDGYLYVLTYGGTIYRIVPS